MEKTLNDDPNGIIPWIELQSISEATSKLLYAAGHVNAIVLAVGRNPNPPNQ